MSQQTQVKKESMLANLLLNIVIPTLILMKGSESPWLLAQLQGLDAQLGWALGVFYQDHGIRLAIVVMFTPHLLLLKGGTG